MRILHPKGRSDRYFSKLGLDVRLTLVVFDLSLDYSWFRWRFSFEVNTPVVTSSDRGLFGVKILRASTGSSAVCRTLQTSLSERECIREEQRDNESRDFQRPVRRQPSSRARCLREEAAGERNGGDILSVTQLAQSMFIEQSRF